MQPRIEHRQQAYQVRLEWASLALRPVMIVPGHGDPVDAAFVARQRDELTEVAALHAAGTIDAATERRSPYPG